MAKKRKPFPKGSVCKPCWELRYCPYGPLVEFFPLYDKTSDLADVETRFNEVLAGFTSGELKNEEDVWCSIDTLMYLNPANWRQLQKYEPEDVGCQIWGHVCPVFLTQSRATETKTPRREGRYIPRDVMLKVVRRDNHVCQECYTYVRDNEVEFDHIIPVSRGGSTSVENLRLLCRGCNRKKSNALDALLSGPRRGTTASTRTPRKRKVGG